MKRINPLKMENRANNLTSKKAPDKVPQIKGDTPVQYSKGVGPARARLLERLGIRTLEDILYYLPWRYEDRRNLMRISELEAGRSGTVLSEVLEAEVIVTPRKRMKILEITVADDTGLLRARWFNQAFLKKYFKKGQKVIFNGMIRGNPYMKNGLEMENPDFELVENEDRLVHTSRVVPVYKATEGISPKQLRTLIYNAVENYIFVIKEFMPSEILERNGLKPLPAAIEEAHFPGKDADVDLLNRGLDDARRRLVFDEFFMLELGLALLKKKETREEGISFGAGSAKADVFIECLPFKLTEAQKRVIGEIREDMRRARPMNRLVHGDVGCGKTVVAAVSMVTAVDNGYQACLMAPTELLAEQHYTNIRKLLGPLGLQPVLITSSTKGTYETSVAEGSAAVVIGTHALIQEHVSFRSLGLAVVDEQHRFGVVQRAALRSKGANPDILVMTATPIPRTLAMTLYGDLDISVIDELPAGRKPVFTRVFFPSQKDKIYSMINRELSRGRQAYIVYPLIEESEKLDLKSAIDGAAALQVKFPGKKIGLVHGKMNRDERDSVMADFKAGVINILVATTVIEVGIDVPNASLMLIIHSERFGLAQLHQLRGRIGRGEYDSYCLLLAYPPLSEESRRRLKAMESTCDGFKIAGEDLAIRGPGDFFGTRQSGIPGLRFADLVRDIKVLETARKEAFDLAGRDPGLDSCPVLKEVLYKKWMGRLELIKS